MMTDSKTDFNQTSRGQHGSVITPHIIYDQGNGRKDLRDVFSHLFDGNVIFVQGQVEENMATSIVAQILSATSTIKSSSVLKDNKTADELAKMKDEYRDAYYAGRTITLMIDSPGGVCTEGNRIVDAIIRAQDAGITVQTVVNGMAASMGSVILAAGTKGHRKAWPGSKIMLHQISGGLQGNYNEMAISLQESHHINEYLKSFFRIKTNMNEEQLAECFTADTWLCGEEALDKGLIDKVDYSSDPDISAWQKHEAMAHWTNRVEAKKAKNQSNHYRQDAKPLPKPE